MYARGSALQVRETDEQGADSVVPPDSPEKLDAGESVTLQAGGDSVTLDPPAQPAFEVKAEREGPTDGPGELSIEFELEWPEDGRDGGGLEIG